MQKTLTQKIKGTIKILETSGINGCITGSSLLDCDFDSWNNPPDIDVFVYSENSFINAIDIMRYRYGFKPGTTDASTVNGEQWKIDRTIKFGMKRNASLSTVKLNLDGVVVNVSYRKGQTTVLDVISNFDMSIIMRGYDIPKGTMLDLRTMASTENVAVPNPLRDQDAEVYVTDQWIRQFDRVIKYWDRGFDTRPMARFYIKLINDTIDKGSLFKTSKSMEFFDEFSKEFMDVREKIELWLEDKED